jgi:hypothetical protein
MVTAEFSRVFKSYHVTEIEGDRYAGEWPREEFQRHGVHYRIAEKSKNELYLELLPALMSAQAELLDNPRLNVQLTGLERRTGRLHDSIDHPPGSHDDVANAVAGALCQVLAWNVTGQLGLMLFMQRRAKEIAEGIRDAFGELIHQPAPKPKPILTREDSKPVQARVEGFAEWLRKGKAPSCPLCQSSATVYINGPRLLCNQCGATDGVLPAPQIIDGRCPVPGCGLKMSWSGGVLRCCNHGQPPGHDTRWPVNGASFAQYKAGRRSSLGRFG